MLLGTLVFLVPPFIPQTADLPFIGLKCATLILIGSTMIYAFLKYSNYKIYIFVFFVFLMRIGFNFTYLGLDPDLSLAISLFFYLSMAVTSLSGLFYFMFPSYLTVDKMTKAEALLD